MICILKHILLSFPYFGDVATCYCPNKPTWNTSCKMSILISSCNVYDLCNIDLPFVWKILLCLEPLIKFTYIIFNHDIEIHYLWTFFFMVHSYAVWLRSSIFIMQIEKYFVLNDCISSMKNRYFIWKFLIVRYFHYAILIQVFVLWPINHYSRLSTWTIWLIYHTKCVKFSIGRTRNIVFPLIIVSSYPFLIK